MLLSLQSRRVGDISVVTCSGRIVGGAESATLHQHLDALLPHQPHIVLNLGNVQFIDSLGLGLLVRFLVRAQAAHGNLKLCAVQDTIAEALRVTRLKTLFESHESEADAISAFYHRATSAGGSHHLKTDILCVDKSADVLAYVRELLRQAGYGVLSADNLPDALTLLQATGAKLVVIAAELRVMRGTQTAERFNRLADARSVVELPADFSSRDAGEAGHHLLEQVRAIMPASDPSVTAAQ